SQLPHCFIGIHTESTAMNQDVDEAGLLVYETLELLPDFAVAGVPRVHSGRLWGAWYGALWKSPLCL
ncbi:MAG: hypothetical protein N3G20_08120, partial [Verrucomicrobiae bacterium]|nr:hypothetical protein [Verrucomicrobiae bacterium]